MGFENLGPNVSQNPQAVTAGGGAYTAEDHSWEQLIIQQNKPVADWEMNLLQGILGPSGVRQLNARLMPSGWLNPGFMERPVPTSYIFLNPDTTNSTTANLFQLAASDINVNGWLIHFDLSQDAALQSAVSLGLPQITAGYNYVLLPPPPLSGQRTDFIVLEVWRALVSPAPTATNKSPAGQLLRYGNVKAPDVNPNVNLADDLIDPVYLEETARRVQIQYRYRVVPVNVDFSSFPDGLDAPGVAANTTPVYPSPGVDGSSSGLPFTQVPNDPGLWRAGSGDQPSANILGTVDGYMYAIPVCAISRRNAAPFNRNTNLNGAGLMASGVSGRPDGYYADQIVAGDVIDLRKGIAHDFVEILQKTLQELLDNTLASQLELSQAYGVSNIIGGTSFTYKDDITASPYNVPGHIGSSDGVRENFSDRAVTETIAATIGLIVGPTNTVTFHLNAITPSYTGAPTLNLATLAPANTNISGINKLRMVTSTPSDIDLTQLSNPFYAQSVVLSASIFGGAIDTVTITLNTAVSNFTIYADLLVEYINGNGASRNVVSSIAFWTPPVANIASWVDPTQFVATSDPTRLSLTNPPSPTVNTNLWWMSPGHRELSVRLRTTSIGPLTYYADTTTSIEIPEKLTGSVTINDGINPPYVTLAYTQNSSYTTVSLSNPVPVGQAIQAIYTALRPIQPVNGVPGDSYTIWYTTHAVQSIPVPSGGPVTLELWTRSIAQQLTLITAGSGSPDDAFPYVSASAQIPVGKLPPSSYPESRLDSPATVSTVGFGINSGYLSMPALIPYTPDPDQVQLYKLAPDTTIDGDSRNFWPRSDSGTPAIYSPVAWAASMSFAQQHKVALPVLMELKSDFNSTTGITYGAIGRKGTLLLVIFSRWGEFDTNVNIGLTPSLGDTCAAVYRVRGNLLNPRRVLP
jgi:hypothetical protein